MLVIMADIHKMLVRIANREDPDHTLLQKPSDLGLHCMPQPFWQAISVQNCVGARSGSVVECSTRDRGTVDRASPASLRCVLEHDTLILA